MCGITGFCDFYKKSTKKTLIEMTDVLHHRGPDDSGYNFYEKDTCVIGLGHRRLSVLDLSVHGHQPMTFDNLDIIYNGEVYNFTEIRVELEKYNYTFHSDSDTEVILKSYHKWGIHAVDKFNGMFAIVIYDKKAEKLIAIRDRAGVKPLYWYFHHELFMFASELKSFHKHIDFQKEIDIDSLSLFLQLGYIPQPYSIFHHTYKLKAGHYLEVDLKSKKVQEIKYWDVIDFYNKPKFDMSENEVIIETEKLLKSAFTYRMVSDVPVGIFLSGGYDSSIVTALLQSNRSEKIKTFTIGFYENQYNEAPHAKKVAQYLGTDHAEYYCSQKEALEIIPSLVEIYDEPFADQSAIPTILVSKIAKEKVTVSLSADGGDEIFGGYAKYLTNLEKKSRIVAKIKSVVGTKKLTKLAAYLQSNGIVKDAFLENKIAKLSFEEDVALQKLIPYFVTPVGNEKLIKGYVYNKLNTSFDEISNLSLDLSCIDKMLAIDYKTYMVDDILHKVDRATMSVSLEGREPLLDFRVIEFVSRLPSRYKIKNGDKKWLLKQITHQYLPKEIMDRPKMGFGIPMEEWLKNELKDYLEVFLSADFDSILEAKELQSVKSLFYQGRVNYQMVWNLLIFQMWYKKWM